MENIQWIFSGIGTEILTLLIGAVMGGLAGYKLGVRKSYTQSQKASDDSKQNQELFDSDISGNSGSKDKNSITKIKQHQKAGKNSEQSQVGRIRNGK